MASMERIDLTPEMSVSRIVYGMWRLGDASGTSPDHVRAKIESCLDQGITTMDLADIYGGYTVEGLFGAALTPDLRDRIEIVTKCGIVAPAGRHAGVRVKHYDTSRAHIEATVDQSLRLMGIERIDMLLIHRPDPFMDHHDTGGALDGLVASGKVRAVGVSNFKPHDIALLQSAMTTPLVANQIEMSLGQTAAFTDGDLTYVQQRGMLPMAWSPLGGGSLMTGKGGHGKLRTALASLAKRNGVEMAAVAVAWLLVHPARILPVMGTNNAGRIAALADALKVDMDRQTWFELYSHANGREVP